MSEAEPCRQKGVHSTLSAGFAQGIPGNGREWFRVYQAALNAALLCYGQAWLPTL